MENLQARVKAAERAARKAKDELNEARNNRSRITAKLDDYEHRLRALRRGREHDALRRKYETKQDRLIDSRAEVRRALDAHAELSKKYLDLLDRLVEAEDVANPNGGRARYEDAEPSGRESSQRRTYTSRTTYHYPSSGEESNDGPRYDRADSFEDHARHRYERSGPSHPRFEYREGYFTEEHVPRSHRRHHHEYPDSSDEEDFTADDYGHYHRGYRPSPPDQSEQDFHPGYARSDRHEQYYTTEEHVPRSERHRHRETRSEHRQHSSRNHHPEPETRRRDQRERPSYYTTEEHIPRSARPSYNEGSQSGSRRPTGGKGPYSPHRPQPSTPQPARLPSQQTVNSWWKYVNDCFANYSKIQQFPSPPALSCGQPDCDAASSSRPIAACECNVRASFGMVSTFNVRRERLRWHPDKFTACPAHLRENFQKMASEVFIVLDKMHKENQ